MMTAPAPLTIPFAVERAAEPERDLLLLEQGPWRNCGVLTRVHLARYLRHMFADEKESGSGDDYVNCCGYGLDTSIPIRAYPLAPDVRYTLQSTIGGFMGESRVEELRERETLTFDLTTRATIRHPAFGVASARWLTGPWTVGGASIPPPPLTAQGREIVAPMPVYGSVELILHVRRYTYRLLVTTSEGQAAMKNGPWSEWVVGLPDGGRPVAIGIEEPHGWVEMLHKGLLCGRGGGGISGEINGPDDDDDDEEPEAQGEDKRIECDYCKLECEKEEGEGTEKGGDE